MKFCELASVENGKLFVFAGPNGSGKSTLIANLYSEKKLSAEYVNADLYCKTAFAAVVDVDERNRQAMFYTMDKVKKYIAERKSFCYETVLSHPSKIDILREAKEKGYQIISVFVFTGNPNINVNRVALRATQGGHDVPEDKIVSRYYRSLELSKKLKEISDLYFEFDNSTDLPVISSLDE